MSRDGRGYSGALILACRKTLPDEVSTAEGFAAALRREFKNLPEVRAVQLSCGLPMAPHMATGRLHHPNVHQHCCVVHVPCSR